MEAYQNKKTGEIFDSETYNELSYMEQLDFVKTQSEEKKDSNGDFVVSAIIGSATDSAILGGLLGDSITGGIFGDILDGDLFD